MPIRVTCPGCHTRFNVSDKFAGKEGPCPKCSKTIRIPDKTEEVVIHAPETGPTDSKGRPILKPIARKEMALSTVQIVLIAASFVGFFAAAVVMRLMVEDKQDFPLLILAISAVLVGPPVVLGAYSFLRDSELGGFDGAELWMRVGICSVVYAALWLAMPVMEYAFDGYEPTAWGIALAAMIGLGGGVAMASLDLDYVMGLVHAAIYFGVCLLGRWIIGIGFLPGMAGESIETETSWRVVVSLVGAMV